MRNVATFNSDLFNLTESKDYFANPSCFGDDFANWLIGKLQAQGIEVNEEPRQEDFGWYLRYVVDGVSCCAVIGNQEEKSWFVVIERQGGVLSSMLGQRHKNIPSSAINAISTALQGEPRIEDVQWFHWAQFEKGLLDNGATTPGD